MAKSGLVREKVVLIVGPQETAAVIESVDRKGGETHSLRSAVAGLAKVDIDPDLLGRNLDRCLGQVEGLLVDLAKRTVKGWAIENISVSLAVSAEGSIGIATGGLEASIEVSFARSK